MAIPFYIPEPSEIEEEFQEFVRTVLDLCLLLLGRGRRRRRPAGNNNLSGRNSMGRRVRDHEPEPLQSSENPSQLPLPDLVQSVNHQVFTARVFTKNGDIARLRTRGISSEKQPLSSSSRRRWGACDRVPFPTGVELPPAKMARSPEDEWIAVGRELRKIADEFGRPQDKNNKCGRDQKMSVTGSLLLLFLPLPFNISLGTVILLFLRWRMKICFGYP